jgi:hypothetical protein
VPAGSTGLPVPTLALAITPDMNGAYTVSSAQNAQEAQLTWIDLTTGATTPSNVMGIAFATNDQLYVADYVDRPQP